MNNKESVNYNVEKNVVISRSPVIKKTIVKPFSNIAISNINSVNKTFKTALRNSFTENIGRVNRVLDESNRILPYRK